MDRTILNLEDQVAELGAEDRARFNRLFAVSTTTGRLEPPDDMLRWIEAQFGSVAAVEQQRIVKVTNIVTLEGTLFNALRAARPMPTDYGADLDDVLESEMGGDTFADPPTGTPADVFGRIKGQHCTTASNVAKFDGFHGVTIFDEYNPLVFSREHLADYMETAKRWAEEAYAVDRRAPYFFLMWNCLWKAGASILHGHMQMTLTRDMHYAKVEHLRRAAASYREDNGESYFDALFAAHDALDLQVDLGGVSAIASLTPVKEKEVILRGAALDESMPSALYRVLAFYRKLGVVCFNVAVYLPPMIEIENEDWSDFPTLVRVVDRGDPFDRTADVGGMELYAQSVVASDPFVVASGLRASTSSGTLP